MLSEKLNEYTRNQICERLEITRKTLNNWENYKTHNIFKYLELCEFLQINPFDELENFRRMSKKNSIDE